MNREIWKDVKGYEGLYQVSNFGEIKHLPYDFRNISGTHHINERKLIPHTNNNGYYMVDLYKNNKRKTLLLHRLVAQAFVENPNNYPIVNHKDNTPSNCNASNLEWCTLSYNSQYSYNTTNRAKTTKWSKGKNHYKSKKVYATDKQGKILYRFNCIMDAERELGILNTSIVSCLKGKYKTAGGFIWHYDK